MLWTRGRQAKRAEVGKDAMGIVTKAADALTVTDAVLLVTVCVPRPIGQAPAYSTPHEASAAARPDVSGRCGTSAAVTQRASAASSPAVRAPPVTVAA